VSLERLVELCSTNPARVLSLQDRGTLKSGARADVTILDPECAWNFDVLQSKSKSRNTPFDGYQFNGAAIATIVGGRIVHLQQAYFRLRQSAQNSIIERSAHLSR
jgi:dihydroorotase